MVLAKTRLALAQPLSGLHTAGAAALAALPTELEGSRIGCSVEGVPTRLALRGERLELALTTALVFWRLDQVPIATKLVAAVQRSLPALAGSPDAGPLRSWCVAMQQGLTAFTRAREAGRVACEGANWGVAAAAFTNELPAVERVCLVAGARLRAGRAAARSGAAAVTGLDSAKRDALLRDAIADCADALAAHPGCLQALLQRGRGRARLRDWNGAVADLRQVVAEVRAGRRGVVACDRVDVHMDVLEGELRSALTAAGGGGGGGPKAAPHGRGPTGQRAREKSPPSARERSPPSPVRSAFPVDVDLYKLLGIEPTATATEIRKAYLVAAKKYHPDKHAGSPPAKLKEVEAIMKKVVNAYEILSDERAKREYDARRRK